MSEGQDAGDEDIKKVLDALKMELSMPPVIVLMTDKEGREYKIEGQVLSITEPNSMGTHTIVPVFPKHIDAKVYNDIGLAIHDAVNATLVEARKL